MVAAGELGDIRVVQAEYAQDWLTEPLGDDRPEAGEVAHRPEAVGRRRLRRRHRHPRLQSRLLRDRARARRRSAPTSAPSSRAAASTTTTRSCCAAKGGARGMLWASQVAPGNENGLMLRVYGTKGGLEWRQEDTELSLVLGPRRAAAADHARRRRSRPRGRAASRACRPAIPRAISRASPPLHRDRPRIRAARSPGAAARRRGARSPAIDDGVAASAFIEAAVASSRAADAGSAFPVELAMASIETLIDLFIDAIRLHRSDHITACLPRPPSLKSPPVRASARRRSTGSSTSGRASTPRRCSGCSAPSPRSARRRSGPAAPRRKFALRLRPARRRDAVPGSRRPAYLPIGRYPQPAHHRDAYRLGAATSVYFTTAWSSWSTAKPPR